MSVMQRGLMYILLCVLVKPGVCQPPSPECRFIRPKGQCKDDGDCERNLKCCTTYCFPQCLPPMPERPGRPQPRKYLEGITNQSWKFSIGHIPFPGTKNFPDIIKTDNIYSAQDIFIYR